MKNLYNSLIAVAVAAMTITGCSKDPENLTPDRGGFTLNLIADGQIAGDTRTEYDPVLKNIKWSEGDVASIYIRGAFSAATATLTQTPEGGNTATFSGTVGSAITAAGSYSVQGFYPNAAFVEVQQNSDKTGLIAYALKLPTEQTASLTSFDKNADILIAKNMDVEITAEDIAARSKTIDNVRFGRAMAVSKYTFTIDPAQTAIAASEVVESVTWSVESQNTVNLTGRFRFAPATGMFVSDLAATTPITDMNNVFYYGGASSVTVKFSEPVTLGNLVMWAVTAPVTLNDGDKLVFTIKTDKNTIVRTSALSGKKLEFVNTKLNTATVKLGTENIVITPNAVGQTATLTMGEIAEIRNNQISGKYGDFSYTNTFGVWSGNAYGFKSSNDYALQINTSSTNKSYILTPEFSGTIQSIELTLLSTSKNAVYLNTSVSTTDPVSTHKPASSVSSISFDLTSLPKTYSQIYIVGGSVQIKEIKIVWQEDSNPRISAEDISGIPAVGVTNAEKVAAYTVSNSSADAEVSAVDGTVVTEAISDAGTLLYSVAPNYGAEAREGSITLTLAGDPTVTKTIIVSQAGSVYEVSPASITLAGDINSTAELTLTSDFEVGTPVVSAPDKFSVSGPVNNVYTVTALADGGAAEAELGTITFTRIGNDIPLVVPVKQLPKGAVNKQYNKVTEDLADWSGEYLIVAHNLNNCFTGSVASNWGAVEDVTIENNQILSTATTDGYACTIVSSGSGYTIQLPDGKFIAKSATGKFATGATGEVHSIIFDAEKGITLKQSNKAVLRCNTTSSNRFRYYTSNTGILVDLYKLSN